MEILIFDTESRDNDIYDIVSKHLNIKFIKVNNTKEFYNFYKKDLNSLIIIDVSENEGEELFQYITNNTPKQKILVLSKTLSYNLSFTCAQCSDLFNRKLLLKPINVKDLINYIQNFNNLLCKYSSNSNNIVEIMEDILKQFIHYYYEKDNKKIINRTPERANVKELVAITQLLAKHKIKYNIEDENIKLHF